MKIYPISSPENSKFRTWLSLQTAKGIKKEGLCLVSGPKLLSELRSAEALICVDSQQIESLPQLCETAFMLSPTLFRELDTLGTHHPLAVVRTPEVANFDFETPPVGIEIVVPFSDPGNLGAVIRSAAAFGVSRVILTEESANPFLPRAIRGSSGSCFKVPLARASSIKNCKEGVGLDMVGPPIHEFHFTKNTRLVVGEEGQGLPPGFRGTRVHIPIHPGSESLNALAAASIALYLSCSSKIKS